jgi:hypothetical protein
VSIREYDLVVLTVDLPEKGLKAGDVGTALVLHEEGVAAEVEFMTEAGETIAVLTLLAEQMRPAREDEIRHHQ